MSSRFALAQRTAKSWPLRYSSAANESASTPSPKCWSTWARQDGFTQSARAAVNEHDELFLAQAELCESAGVEHLLDRLQFGEVVATAERAQRGIEVRGLEIVFSKEARRRSRPADVRGRSADSPSDRAWRRGGAGPS